MQISGEVFSLWVGKSSQQLAHHFYALQAQQFFDESEDPTQHNSIWKLYDSTGQRKKPYFLTFDTQIPHLSYMRKTNQAKIISQMQKSTMKLQQYYFPLEYQHIEEDKEKYEQKDKYLYERWQATESNYSVVDKNFIQDCDSFDYWKDVFRSNSQIYEDKVRKNLENLDFLKYITFTSDLQRSGFSQELLIYMKDECPKKDVFFFQLENTQKNSFYEVSKLQSFAQMATLSQTFLNLKTQIPHYRYFQGQNLFIHLAPLLNSLITPLCLKQNRDNYLSNILTNARRNIFDVAYTLPIIDHELYLNKSTNILDYLLENKNEKFFGDQQSIRADAKKQHSNELQDEHHTEQNQIYQNRINYGSDYLGLRKPVKNKFQHKVKTDLYPGLISQAYVLKGHIKGFQKIFTPNVQLLDLKYMEGILCNYHGNEAKYDKKYIKTYGQNVVNYPFHSVLFQHQNFGDYLRTTASHKNKKNKNQLQEQWKQNLLSQADYYKQVKEEDD